MYMKKTISKNLSDAEKTLLIKTLKNSFDSNGRFLKLEESKNRPFTFGFYNGDAQLIWLFLRSNSTYSYLHKEKGSHLIDSSTAFGIIPNNYDPANLTLPMNYRSGFEITLYEELSTLQKKVDILKWSLTRQSDELSDFIGTPKLFFLYPALSEEIKEKVLLSAFKRKSEKNTFTYKGYMDIENKYDLVKLIIAHYLIKFPSGQTRGAKKEAVEQYEKLYREITGKFSGIVRYSTLAGWPDTFSRVSDLAPFCFYNKSLKRKFA